MPAPKLIPSLHLAALAAAREIQLTDSRREPVREIVTREGLVGIATNSDHDFPILVFAWTDGITDAFAEEALRC